MKTIVVNATALDGSGALSILRQFVDAIPVDRDEYIIFVGENVSIKTNKLNIRIIPKDVKSFRKRFIWDAFGVKGWLKDNNIKPHASLSLQNTNFRVGGDIPNFVYFHQSMPFFKKSWSPIKSQERVLWFYKHIYPFFVNLFLNNRTEIFVQLEFIKQGFADRFEFPKSKIHVISPEIILPSLECASKGNLDENRINLFYPATVYFYKNHKKILDALSLQKDGKFRLYLTCKETDIKIPRNVDVVFMGTIPFEQVLTMYYSVDALLFPSYIETYGLPLIEAASFGVPILVSDLPYSREVLNEYEGVIYINHENVKDWALCIENLEKRKRYTPLTLSKKDSWQELFRIIKLNI